MSASREKKKRQEFLASGGVDPKAARAAEQQAAEKKAKILYSTLAVVFVVVAVFLVVYNSGILQRSKTAVTIDGENYTVADVSYYYQLSFHDGRFWGEALGEKVVDRCQLNGMEVSEADFNTWYEENMTNDVTWYASDGAVIPENM